MAQVLHTLNIELLLAQVEVDFGIYMLIETRSKHYGDADFHVRTYGMGLLYEILMPTNPKCGFQSLSPRKHIKSTSKESLRNQEIPVCKCEKPHISKPTNHRMYT